MPKKPPDPNRPRRWQAILRRLPQDIPICGAEIGVWMGRTARELLEARPLLIHYMVDAWTAPDPGSSYAETPDSIAKQPQSYFNECYRKTVRCTTQYGDRAKIIRAWSQTAVEMFDNHSLDFVFIDAEHSYEGVKRDTLLWLPKVKPGGWIGGHDYGNLPRFPGVAQAVDELFGDDKELDGDCTWFHRIAI